MLQAQMEAKAYAAGKARRAIGVLEGLMLHGETQEIQRKAAVDICRLSGLEQVDIQAMLKGKGSPEDELSAEEIERALEEGLLEEVTPADRE